MNLFPHCLDLKEPSGFQLLHDALDLLILLTKRFTVLTRAKKCMRETIQEIPINNVKIRELSLKQINNRLNNSED